MRAVRTTCILLALACFVHVFEIASGKPSGPEPAPNTTALPPNGSTVPTKPTDAPTTKPTDAPTTKPTDSPTTKPTAAPTTKPTEPPTPPKTTTPVPTSTSTTSPPTTSTPSPTPTPTTPSTTTHGPTTATPPPTTPCPPDDRHFDGLSFMGGIILTGGLVAIGFVLWKFYKARTERNYHTL